MLGYQFRRERPILDYIVDFVCFELMLIIEVDGITHDDPVVQEKDRRKDAVLQKIGFTVIRVQSIDILKRKELVYEDIALWIVENAILPS